MLGVLVFFVLQKVLVIFLKRTMKRFMIMTIKFQIDFKMLQEIMMINCLLKKWSLLLHTTVNKTFGCNIKFKF